MELRFLIWQIVTSVRDHRKTSRKVGNRGNKGTGWEAIYGDLGWMSLESRIIEKKLIFAGRVASLEPENWTRQAWNMAERKRLPWANEIIVLAEEVGLGGERVRIGQGTWKAEVKVAD